MTSKQSEDQSRKADPYYQRMFADWLQHNENCPDPHDAFDEAYQYGLHAGQCSRAATAKAEPVLWVRMLNGKVDWDENCVGPDKDVADSYESEPDFVYEAIPLYAHPLTTPPQKQVGPLREIIDRARSKLVATMEDLQPSHPIQAYRDMAVDVIEAAATALDTVKASAPDGVTKLYLHTLAIKVRALKGAK